MEIATQPKPTSKPQSPATKAMGADLEDDPDPVISHPKAKATSGTGQKRKQAIVISDDDEEEALPSKKPHHPSSQPASQPAPPSSTFTFAAGSRVLVQGLSSEKGKSLNGKTGEILQPSADNSERLEVRLDNGDVHSLKKENLIPTPEAGGSKAAPPASAPPPAPASARKREREGEDQGKVKKDQKVPSVLSSHAQPPAASPPSSAPVTSSKGNRDPQPPPPPSSGAKKPRKSNVKVEPEVDPIKQVSPPLSLPYPSQ